MSMPSQSRVLLIELLAQGPASGWYTRRVKIPNFSGVMTQVVAVWCKELGATVELRTYTGSESLGGLLAGDWDIVFVSAFTQAAYAAYGIASYFRRRGVVTVLGGPHARAYANDSRLWFDYVLGLTDRDIVRRVLEERVRASEWGQLLAAPSQPLVLPGLRERAAFLQSTLNKARLIRVIPLLGSVGCPYSCDFCSDAEVKFRPMPFEGLAEDLRFLAERYPNAMALWMDPNFGVRFIEYLDLIERWVPRGSMRFGAESTLSLLTEPNVERLGRAGFVAMLPGIESWSAYHEKAGLRRCSGTEKVARVADQVSMVLRHIAYVQVNLIFGLGAEHDEDFELTRDFVLRCPGAWPNLNLFTVFGDSAPDGRKLMAEGRTLPVPFALLDQKTCVNVRMDAATLPDFYRKIASLSEAIFGARASFERIRASPHWLTRALHAFRAFGAEERSRIRWYRTMACWLESDRGIRQFFAGETRNLPDPLREMTRLRMGPFHDLLIADPRWQAESGYRPS